MLLPNQESIFSGNRMKKINDPAAQGTITRVRGSPVANMAPTRPDEGARDGPGISTAVQKRRMRGAGSRVVPA